MNAAAPAAAPEQPTLKHLIARFLRFMKESFADPLGEVRADAPNPAAAERFRLAAPEVDGLRDVFDDLAQATWEDAEWQ
jgi:hypothetical protein